MGYAIVRFIVEVDGFKDTTEDTIGYITEHDNATE